MLYEITVKVCVEADDITGLLMEQQKIVNRLSPMNIKETSTREILTTTVITPEEQEE